MRYLVLAFLFGSAAGISGAEPGVEERLARLEQEWEKSRQAASLKLGGMLQVQFEGGRRGDSRWSNDHARALLRRARLGASKDLGPGLDLRLELEMAGALSSAAAGAGSAMRAQLTDGYLRWTPRPAFELRVGQLKTPFGFEQLASDPQLATPERSLANDRLTLGRQVGAQAAFFAAGKRLGLWTGAFNGTGANNAFNDDSEALYVGRLAWEEKGGRLGPWAFGYGFGGGAFHGRDAGRGGQPAEWGLPGNSFSGARHGWSGDLRLRLGRLRLQAEALGQGLRPDSGAPAGQWNSVGGWAQAEYDLIEDRLQAVAKEERYYGRWDGEGRLETQTYTLGLSVLMREGALKLQVAYLNTHAWDLDTGHDKGVARVQALF